MKAHFDEASWAVEQMYGVSQLFFLRALLEEVDKDWAGVQQRLEGIRAGLFRQGNAIANNLMAMMSLKVPILAVVIGEGGSGGALALGIADEVWMLENAIYSVISPEGCASILWKDAAKTKEAANCLKLTAQDLLELQVVDKIISENHRDFKNVYRELKIGLYKNFQKNQVLDHEQLTEQRYQRFRKYGAIETISE